MQDSIAMRSADATRRVARCSRRFVYGWRAALLVFVAAFSGACENPLPPDANPIAPESCGPIRDQTVPAGGSASVQVCFTDANGDRLSLSANSSNGAVASVARVGEDVVEVAGLRGGTATVTVTARDPGGLSATVSFSVWVPAIVRLTDRGREFNPAWSPDGSRIAFMVTGNDRGGGPIFVMNADGSGVMRLTNSRMGLWSFVPLWSPDGSRIAFVTASRNNYAINVVNAAGTGETQLTDNIGYDWWPAWSPDGSRIAFQSRRDGNSEIYVMNADGTGATNLTNNPGSDSYPAWSPDGARIAFVRYRDGNYELYMMNADGSGATQLTSGLRLFPLGYHPVWSPDGSRIAFQAHRGDSPIRYEIYVAYAAGTGWTQLTDDTASKGSLAWSPDGSRIAFMSLRDDNYELSVMNADGTGAANLALGVPHGWGGVSWSPDGRKIAFTCDSGICLVNLRETWPR